MVRALDDDQRRVSVRLFAGQSGQGAPLEQDVRHAAGACGCGQGHQVDPRVLCPDLGLVFSWESGHGIPCAGLCGRRADRIVVVSRIDPADTGALTAAAVSEQARGIIANGLAQARRPVPVAVALAGDAAVVDPTALVVTIHANAAADPARSGLAAIAVAVRRPGQVSDAMPLFPAPPTVVTAGSADAGLQHALRALIVPTVIKPLMSMPDAR